MLPDTRSLISLPKTLQDAEYFSDEPITIFEIDNFLAESYNQRLMKEFPSDVLMYRKHAHGDKKYLQNDEVAFWRCLEQSKPWQDLYCEFLRPENVDALYRLAAPYLAHRGSHERLPWTLDQPLRRREGRFGQAWRRLNSVRGASRVRRVWRSITVSPSYPDTMKPLQSSTPVEIGFEFSLLRKGDSIPPHTDTPSKLLSLMLYFPTSEAQQELPLGTEFYRARDGLVTKREWDSGMPDEDVSAQFFESHSTYYQVPFRPNVLVGFVKTDRSWHGLRSVDPGVSGDRRALVVNVFKRPEGLRSRARDRLLGSAAR